MQALQRAAAAPTRPVRASRATAVTTRNDGKLKVVVTGAGGRTGALVVKKLLESKTEFDAIGVVRGASSKGKLQQLGLTDDAIFFVDLAAAGADAFSAAFKGADALVIATSAVPVLKPLSLIGVFWAKLTGGKAMPEFSWKEGQNPEQVDWLGQKAQIDAAKAAGLKRVVLVSSMGGTDPSNNLNKLGGNGNILQWKRRAEQYLIASGVPYTIIHPGGLIDEPGGQRELRVGVDDALVKETVRSIPRADVAELAVQSLKLKSAANRAFDVTAKKPEDGAPTKDFDALLATLKGANCDYTINSQYP